MQTRTNQSHCIQNESHKHPEGYGEEKKGAGRKQCVPTESVKRQKELHVNIVL